MTKASRHVEGKRVATLLQNYPDCGMHVTGPDLGAKDTQSPLTHGSCGPAPFRIALKLFRAETIWCHGPAQPVVKTTPP